MELTNKQLSKIFLNEPLIKKYSKKTWDDVQDVRKLLFIIIYLRLDFI